MASSIKLKNANGKTLTLENSDINTVDSTLNLMSGVYAIETVDDFDTVPSGINTVVVKDTNRGGTFIWSSTGTANGGTVFAGTTGYWNRQYSGAVSVKWFGAVGDGVTDDTVAIQSAMSHGYKEVYIPSGTYKFTSITIPSIQNFKLHGDGVSTLLMQYGNGIKWNNLSAFVFDGRQTIQGLHINGSNGTSDCIDTKYVQATDILDIFITDIPVGFTALTLDGNPNDGTYCHDMRVNNFRVYSNTLCYSGIRLGSFLADCLISNFQMNGFFKSEYCFVAESGAQTTILSSSHIYNAKKNVVRLNGNNNDFGWDNVVFDNALEDIFVQKDSIRGRFSNCFFEMIQPAFSGVVLDNSHNNSFSVSEFMKDDSKAGIANNCVHEVNGSSGTKLNLGNIDNLSSYSSPFSITGNGSYAKGFQGYSNYSSIYHFVGVAETEQTSNTTVDYGANGAGGLVNTGFCVPIDSMALFAKIAVNKTPASGQNFTFNVQKNGVTIGTGIINSGQYYVVIQINQTVTALSQLSIQSIFSLSSGGASPRYAITLNG